MHTLGDSSLASKPVHRSNIATESLFLIHLRNPRGGKEREGKFEARSSEVGEQKPHQWELLFISYANGKKT